MTRRLPGKLMAIVKELVEAHGGSVEADNSSDLTEIWFSLPGPRNPTQDFPD